MTDPKEKDTERSTSYPDEDLQEIADKLWDYICDPANADSLVLGDDDNDDDDKDGEDS